MELENIKIKQIKNTITEMKNTVEGINRLTERNRSARLSRVVEIIDSEQKEKQNKKK